VAVQFGSSALNFASAVVIVLGGLCVRMGKVNENG
jgi:hypothetical protein